MAQPPMRNVLDRARDMCVHSGGRLTEKRERILELLLVSATPMSAYEVADAYNRGTENSMPANSVYRILEFLESEQLVHKLSSANKYVACSHIACDHAHEVPQFLICRRCQKVQEITVAQRIIEELGEQVANSGYQLVNSQLELQCLCETCSTAPPPA